MYILENEKTIIRVRPLGAELISMIDKANDKELIWQGNPEYWTGHSPVLFPIVGGLKDGYYIYSEEKYQMNRHGIARKEEFSLYYADDNKLIFLLASDERFKDVYPFEFSLFIIYELIESSLKVSYEVLNQSENEMYFSIGAHPAFNLDIEEGDKYLVFDDLKTLDSYRILDERGLINSTKIPVFRSQKEIAIDYDLFKYNTLIFDSLDIKDIGIYDKGKNEKIRLSFENFPYLAVWTPKAPFLCLEPWHGIADFEESNNHLIDKTGIKRLERSEMFSCNYTIEYKGAVSI